MLTVFFRTLIIYFALIFAMRIMGKRQAGELEISELVVTFMLSDLAVIPISDKDIPVSHAILPIIVILSLEVILSFLQTKSRKLKILLSGDAVPIIVRGKLDRVALEKNRIELEELLGELRLCGVFDPADVDYAFLEENGKVSVLTKTASSPLTPAQLGFAPRESGIAHTVVADGNVIPEGLRASGRNQRWLDKFCSDNKITTDDIFLLTVGDSGKLHLALKGSSPRGIKYEKDIPPLSENGSSDGNSQKEDRI